MNITFGTIKKKRDTVSNEKYPNSAVATIEAAEGIGKNKRIMFNSKAMEMLKTPEGVQQNLIFAFLHSDDGLSNRLLVANAEYLPKKEDTVVYITSKNRSTSSSGQKGKIVSSSYLHKEVNDFLGTVQEKSYEYELAFFGTNSGLDLYEFKRLNLITPEKSLEYSNQEDVSKDSLDNEGVDEAIDEEIDENLIAELCQGVQGSHLEIEESQK